MAIFQESTLEGATLLLSEIGTVSGPRFRERWRLVDGTFLDCTRDHAVGNDTVIAWATRAKRCKNWQVDREG